MSSTITPREEFRNPKKQAREIVGGEKLGFLLQSIYLGPAWSKASKQWKLSIWPYSSPLFNPSQPWVCLPGITYCPTDLRHETIPIKWGNPGGRLKRGGSAPVAFLCLGIDFWEMCVCLPARVLDLTAGKKSKDIWKNN